MTTQPSLQVLGLVHTLILVFTQHQRILLARQAQQNNTTTEEPKNDNATKFTSPRFGS